jgi:hypothetical protein
MGADELEHQARGRIDSLAERAQKDKPFTHAFSLHCLRHYAEFRTMPSKIAGPSIFGSFSGQDAA